MLSRRLATALLVSIASLVLTGCGGGGTPTEQQSVKVDVPGSTAAARPGVPIQPSKTGAGETRQTPNRELVGEEAVTEKYDGGGPKSEGQIRKYNDGKTERIGKWTEWYPNGQKFLEGEYRDGVKVDAWTFWHENGQQAKKGSYSNGAPDANWTFWRADGTLEREVHYLDTKRHGTWVYYWEKGGKKREENYDRGVAQGKWTIWYDNGNVEAEMNFLEGKPHGLQAQWYISGLKKSEDNWKNGERHGRSIAWDEAGKPDEYWYNEGRRVPKVEAEKLGLVKNDSPAASQ